MKSLPYSFITLYEYYNFYYSWVYYQPDDGYIYPKHVAGLHTGKVEFGM